MKRITPHLWFDKQAKEAAEFYTSTFKTSKVDSVKTLHNTPSGSVDLAALHIKGQEFRFISAGPLFKFNPSVSFLVTCESKEEVDAIWARLAHGGSVRMPIGPYPHSERYGWIEDRFGLSWQIMLAHGRQKQEVIPTLMFAGKNCGKAEEAVHYYTHIFQHSLLQNVHRYENGELPDKEGTVRHVGFKLDGYELAAMDSARVGNVIFNEAISFIVNCTTQAEIDYYWEKLSSVPEAEQCGWCKDRYGVSWQIVPTAMESMMTHGTKDQLARVTEAFLKMKKFDLEKLNAAYAGK